MSHSIQLPRFGHGPKREADKNNPGLAECPICGNIYFKKRWLAASLEFLKRILRGQVVGIHKSQICPACKMVASHNFEGELLVLGFGEHLILELLGLIHNFGEQAVRADAQDRIIKIEKIVNGYRITTTQNQMVQKLAHKIKDAFNSVEIQTTHSSEPQSLIRVQANFLHPPSF